MKKKKKRDPLNLNHQTKTRKSYIDYDYVNKLSPKEREFLARFTDEFYGGAFEKSSEDTYSKKNLHKTQQLRRECYKRNRDQLHCLYNLANFSGKLDDIDDIDLNNQNFHTQSPEDQYLANEDYDIKLKYAEKLKDTNNGSNSSNKAAKNPNSSFNKRKVTK